MDKVEDKDTALFASLRAEMARLDAPRCVEKELMQAFARRYPRRRWYERLASPAWSLTASAASAALVVVAFLLGPGMPDVARGPAAPALALVERDSAGGVFVALDSFERIEVESTPRLIEAEVPRTMLAPLGLEITPENAGDTVKAEMLVAANGDPLALRLTSPY